MLLSWLRPGVGTALHIAFETINKWTTIIAQDLFTVRFSHICYKVASLLVLTYLLVIVSVLVD